MKSDFHLPIYARKRHGEGVSHPSSGGQELMLHQLLRAVQK